MTGDPVTMFILRGDGPAINATTQMADGRTYTCHWADVIGDLKKFPEIHWPNLIAARMMNLWFTNQDADRLGREPDKP